MRHQTAVEQLNFDKVFLYIALAYLALVVGVGGAG